MSGYYPFWLFGAGQMASVATAVQFGGEVFQQLNNNPSTNIHVPMGSGINPNTQLFPYGNTAYQRNLVWMDAFGLLHDFASQWLIYQPASSGCAYGMWYNGSNSPARAGWGTSIFFGGTGNSPNCF